jgi:adenosylcobinamide amidohydrolase
MRPGVAISPATPESPDLVRRGRWLITRFACPQQVLSWAIVGGGRRTAEVVAWYRVRESELRPPADAREFLRRRLADAAIPDAVALLTSRDLDAHVAVSRHRDPFAVRCIATVGLGNALRAGDPPGPAARIGTINLLCCLSHPVTEEALVEALALAAEARTVAVLEAAVSSRMTGRPATGTGTDCIVVAAPLVGRPVRYVGKHTALGSLIGAAVGEATRHGVERWRADGAS